MRASSSGTKKREHDGAHPFGAMRRLDGDSEILARSSDPVRGAATLPASQWKSYLKEADHPEYLSGSHCLCAAQAREARLVVDTHGVIKEEDNALRLATVFPPGSSRVEPGTTPTVETTILFKTWSDLVADCGQSRVWASEHFEDAVDEGHAIWSVAVKMAGDHLLTPIAGETSEPWPPGRGRPVHL